MLRMHRHFIYFFIFSLSVLSTLSVREERMPINENKVELFGRRFAKRALPPFPEPPSLSLFPFELARALISQLLSAETQGRCLSLSLCGPCRRAKILGQSIAVTALDYTVFLSIFSPWRPVRPTHRTHSYSLARTLFSQSSSLAHHTLITTVTHLFRKFPFFFLCLLLLVSLLLHLLHYCP